MFVALKLFFLTMGTVFAACIINVLMCVLAMIELSRHETHWNGYEMYVDEYEMNGIEWLNQTDLWYPVPDVYNPDYDNLDSEKVWRC